MGWVLFILTGGIIAIGGPPALAIWLVERHANATADAIRKQHPQPVPAQTRPRQKELTHR